MKDTPHTIGERYVVEAVLGRGGMGTVCRVRDLRSGRCMALKRGFTRDSKKTDKRNALLQREYHTLVQLVHPHIVEVYDYGLDDEGPYYTMELLDGADLSHSGLLPWRDVAALMYDVASSLAILHLRGLIHRDISPRNVRRTADGRAKLFDFGAMQSMGVAKDVVGTPPFMAPEVLHMQTLDARADLFSLGALGYFLLTGRHAYAARRLRDLRDAWRTVPASPSRILDEIPQALSALIIQMVALDRSARPQTAAEVMERLRAIAGLPAEQRPEITRAYLATPVLVGRDRALTSIRRAMLSLVRQDGGSMLVRGVAGSGRTRMLDACALEAKLLGAHVVRADAADYSSGEWGGARALCRQLFDVMHEDALEASALDGELLRHVIDNLPEGELVSEERTTGDDDTAPHRSRLTRALRDWVLTLAKKNKILIVVDDAESVDEPSAGLIAALVHKTERHPLMVALALGSEAEHSATWESFLRSVSTPIELENLSSEQTETLIGSLFGGVANVPLVAGRIHAIAHGNPAATMELAQHLVSRGLARHEAGSWVLPSALDESDLPTTLSASLGARLAELGPDALELARALSLVDRDAITLLNYPMLTSHRDPHRVFPALDELVAARVLNAEVDRYVFNQRAFVPILREGMDRAHCREVHSRVADVLADAEGDSLRIAHHLFEADRDAEAIALLESLDLLALLPPLALLERAVERAEQHPLPARVLHKLRMALLSKSSLELAVDAYARAAPHVLGRLERESGLARHRELAGLPPAERLSRALAETQQSYLALPEDQRVMEVTDAIRELARLGGTLVSMAVSTYDGQMLASFPSIEALLPLSPALVCVHEVMRGGDHWMRGRMRIARDVYLAVLERIAQPDRGGLDAAQHSRTQLGLELTLGLVDAATGSAEAETRARTLEGDRRLRVNAWQLRMLLHLNQGNLAAARKCARRAELIQLQDGIEPRYSSTVCGFEVRAHIAAGDILGVKSSLEAVTRLAERHKGWVPMMLHGQSHYRLLQGDPQGALDVLMPVLELARPGEHGYFIHGAATHVELLTRLGHCAEALEHGRRYRELCAREELSSPDQAFDIAFAQALGAAGEHAEARVRMDEAIAEGKQMRKTGLVLGVLYEEAARLAIRRDDRAAFERMAELCAAEYNKVHHPALAAKFARLLEEANRREIEVVPRGPDMHALASVSQTETGYETLHSRIRECIDHTDRAQCALSILLQSVDSFAGALFGVQADGGVRLLAALPEPGDGPALADWVRECVATELEVLSHATVTADEQAAPPSIDSSEDSIDDNLNASRSQTEMRFFDEEGRCFEPVPVIARRARPHRLAAVLVRHVAPGSRMVPNRLLMSEIASELIEHGDVGGVTLAF